MIFTWIDYNPETMGYVENWLDEHAVRMTGMDDGFRQEYEYWANEDYNTVGENFWCKVFFENGVPFAVIEFGLYEGVVTVMEIIVAPEKRGQGMGSKAIKELLENSKNIIGIDIEKAEAIIFPSNIASQKAFEKAGFKYHSTHEDGDATTYVYEVNSIAKHYDILINEGNDPVHDPEPLKAYMDKWDGQVFIDKMQLSKDKSVLEIGVGTGRLAVRTAPLCKEFYGIDISPETIKGVTKNLEEYQNVNLICDDFMTHNFNTTFDVIYSSLTFMHIKDKQGAINKVQQLLKNGGLFVLSTDKNQDQFIDIGTNKIEVYPDTAEEITQCINISGLKLLEHYETEFANVFVCKKELNHNNDIMNQNEYWNSVAEEKKFTTVLDVELFSKYVSKDCKILDVGCGYGRILNELAEAGFTDLTGVDSAENMIKRGLREYPNLNLVANPDGKLPFEENTFDAVILFGVLTCVPDNESQKVLLNDIKRVLKTGGIIYINDFLLNTGFKRWFFYKKAQKETGIYGAFKTYDGATVRHHAENYILNLLSDFKTLDYQKFVIPTMNGNKSNSFGFIGELKK